MILEDLDKSELIKMIRDLQRDQLTGLYRREQICEIIKDNYVVAMLDINDLKRVNDRHGHAEGDRLIKQVASNIKSCVRCEDTVIRYGGDEFVVIFDNCNKEQVEVIVSRIKLVSYGIGESNHFDRALKKADKNMYLKKQKLHGRFGK